MHIVHFHNGSGGGVLSVIRNLLAHQQRPELQQHVIYTINREQVPNYEAPGLIGAASEQVFYYSANWNFYYTCKQLAKLLPAADAVLVAHDWLELGMVSMLGLQNPVVQVLHGDFSYYYQLAQLHRENIDIHICVSRVIEKKLKSNLQQYAPCTIIYERFPAPDVEVEVTITDEIQIAYFVRDVTEERKQMCVLPLIEMALRKKGLFVHWYIAGKGMNAEEFKQFWGNAFSERVHYLGELDRVQLDSLLRSCNTMILPSLSEGFPVAVVEAMKYGLVPLISYWDGAVEDLVVHNQSGFFFEKQDPESYANGILLLNQNPAKFKAMRIEAQRAARDLYDPSRNALSYENLFVKAGNDYKLKKAFKAYGSRLDQKFIPNFFVAVIRKITS